MHTPAARQHPTMVLIQSQGTPQSSLWLSAEDIAAGSPQRTVDGGAGAQVGGGVAGDPGDDGGGGDAHDDGRLEVARHQDGHDRQAAQAHPQRAAAFTRTQNSLDT